MRPNTQPYGISSGLILALLLDLNIPFRGLLRGCVLIPWAIPAAISEHVKLMDSGLPQRASEHMKKRLYELADRHICIGDVRGVGHFWALEIVKNRKTKEPFDTKPDKFSGKALMTGKPLLENKAHAVYRVADLADREPFCI